MRLKERFKSSRILVFYGILLFFLFAIKCKSPSGPETQESEKGYFHYLLGNSQDAVTNAFPGYVLMGGGRDVDFAFKWMIDKSAGGDFVVIRATGTDAYNSYIYNMGNVDSVETFVIYSKRGANNDFVIQRLIQAEAVFIAGGNQADYTQFWKGTALTETLKTLLFKGIPLGGTSAGVAVLGEFVFSALKGTVYSDEALSDPYNPTITIDQNFINIPLLNQVITDSHFSDRDRMGRLVVFLARIMKDYELTFMRGIGIDEETALMVLPDGSSEAYGTGHVYFLSTDHQPETCDIGVPLTFRDIHVYRIGGNGSFHLSTWQGFGGISYFVSAEKGNLVSSMGSIY
jgi:cyanophycinase